MSSDDDDFQSFHPKASSQILLAQPSERAAFPRAISSRKSGLDSATIWDTANDKSFKSFPIQSSMSNYKPPSQPPVLRGDPQEEESSGDSFLSSSGGFNDEPQFFEPTYNPDPSRQFGKPDQQWLPSDLQIPEDSENDRSWDRPSNQQGTDDNLSQTSSQAHRDQIQSDFNLKISIHRNRVAVNLLLQALLLSWAYSFWVFSVDWFEVQTPPEVKALSSLGLSTNLRFQIYSLSVRENKTEKSIRLDFFQDMVQCSENTWSDPQTSQFCLLLASLSFGTYLFVWAKVAVLILQCYCIVKRASLTFFNSTANKVPMRHFSGFRSGDRMEEFYSSSLLPSSSRQRESLLVEQIPSRSEGTLSFSQANGAILIISVVALVQLILWPLLLTPVKLQFSQQVSTFSVDDIFHLAEGHFPSRRKDLSMTIEYGPWIDLTIVTVYLIMQKYAAIHSQKVERYRKALFYDTEEQSLWLLPNQRIHSLYLSMGLGSMRR